MRIGNISRLVSMSWALALALMVGICAQAQTSSPQSGGTATSPQASSPERPQTEPSQQNPAATPAPEPQQNAPTQAAPSAQNPPAATQSNQPRPIDEELQLTPDQKQKIAAVVDDENRQISAVRDDNSMTLEQKQQKVMQIRQAGSPKIKAILTPEQLQKLAAIQQRMRDEQNSQGGTGQSQPSQSQPSQSQPSQSQQGTQSTPQH